MLKQSETVQKNQTILAIDPGYDRVGWAIGTSNKGKLKPIACGIIQTDSKQLIGQRYQHIVQELRIICDNYEPRILAIEKLYFSKNTTTALRVSEAKGVIIACCLDYVKSIYEYDPGTIKLAVTGNGSANKEAVEKMIRMQLTMRNSTLIDDTIDALAILMTHVVSHSPLHQNENDAIL